MNKLTSDMTSRSYFGKMNLTLGSVVPLAMLKIQDRKTQSDFPAAYTGASANVFEIYGLEY